MKLTRAHLRTRWIAPVLLALLTFTLYAPVRDYEFVQYDDPLYVTENPTFREELTRGSVTRAFREPYVMNWTPLTWLSLRVDRELFDFAPRGYHLVSVGLHALSAGLLYSALAAMSGSPGPSLFVAAVFAVHPLHVESVAWISERKDVLSGVFFMLTLLAYDSYVRVRKSSARPGATSTLIRYAWVLVCFVAGLLAKPMLVTLPLILLLLDYWPLDRIRGKTGAAGSTPRRLAVLVAEKIPLLAMSVAAALGTLQAQHDAGAVANDGIVAPLYRIANAVESLWFYIGDSLWPSGLSVFYPHPGNTISPWSASIGAVGLLVVTLLFFRLARSRPFLIVGWMWYLICLLPVIGIVQAGMQARADRYTYLAQTGLAIALAWTAKSAASSSSRARTALMLAGAVAVGLLCVATRLQLPHWRNTRSLYEHAIAVTDANFIAHRGLAAELLTEGEFAEAERHYRRAIEIKPRWPEAHLGRGDALLALGRRDEAIASYRRSVEAAPARPLGHVHLAEALVADGQIEAAIVHLQKALLLYRGQPVPEIHARYAAALAINADWEEAVRQYRHAIRLQPDFAQARSKLAFLLARRGEYAAAREQFVQALSQGVDSAETHAGLASAARRLGDTATAVRHYEIALQLRPDWLPAANPLAWILATDPNPAIRDPRRAAALMGGLREREVIEDPTSLDILAAAYAALGRFDAAVSTADAAAKLARDRDRPALSAAIESRRAGYARREAFIDPGPEPAPRSWPDASGATPPPQPPR